MKCSNEILNNIFTENENFILKEIQNDISQKRVQGKEKYYPIDMVLNEMEQIVKGASIEDFECL